jgi:hypothetical protein
VVSEKRLLYYLKEVGIPLEVPAGDPPKGKPLARGVCPLHDDADNRNAFLIFGDGFACQTHACHTDKRFGNNLHGLIRHLAYRSTGRVMSWPDSWRYACSNKHQIRELLEEVKLRRASPSNDRPKQVTWSADDLRACLSTPDPYYLGRGYLPTTLAHFGVGSCVRTLPDGNNLLGWSVFPVLRGKSQPLAGYTARNPKWRTGHEVPKWYHGFSRNDILFNSHAALCRGPILLCEGPGCVMRFHEAGFGGAVATCGADLSTPQYYQFLRLLQPGRRVLVTADNDDAGRKFAETVVRQVRGVCVTPPEVVIAPGAKDFGDLTTHVVCEWMANYLSGTVPKAA